MQFNTPGTLHCGKLSLNRDRLPTSTRRSWLCRFKLVYYKPHISPMLTLKDDNVSSLTLTTNSPVQMLQHQFLYIRIRRLNGMTKLLQALEVGVKLVISADLQHCSKNDELYIITDDQALCHACNRASVCMDLSACACTHINFLNILAEDRHNKLFCLNISQYYVMNPIGRNRTPKLSDNIIR